MERESFEDREVADILNKHFIAIKVDREERPDIDTIYMAVCQAITGHGGWPLTVFLTPDKKPFFAGTYFPKTSARGMPGLVNILTRISHMWTTKKEDLLLSGEDVMGAVERSMFSHTAGEISEDALHRAFNYFDNSFDAQYGGFGKAPKFPTPHNLSFLLRYWKMTGQDRALEMVEKTLESMYLGGIYDHIGFGFARYSTDRRWLVPHFEKMLYDNALLAIAYFETYQITGKGLYAKAAREIFTYILRDMTSPEGGFYSAEDADSEGEEGKFYVWTPEQIKEVLGEDDGARFCRDYDIRPGGNFEGKSIPNLIETGFIERHGQDREYLFRKREERVHPFKDDKILTGWNGLMIAAMAFGSRVLGERLYAKAAESAVDFIMKNLRRRDGRLLARYREGEAAFPAYAEDYAYLIWGLIELYQATFKVRYLELALELNGDLLKYFWDDERGGLYHYGSDAENLPARPKEVYDGALPSANSVAALNFLRLGRLTGNPELTETGRAQINAFGGSVQEAPMSHAHFLMAVYFDLAPGTDITIVGTPDTDEFKQIVDAVNGIFGPDTILTAKPVGEEGRDAAKIMPWLGEQTALDGKATVYICKGYACHEPITDVHKLVQILQDK